MDKAGNKLKLDLHTHPGESENVASPTVDMVGRIVAVAKERGLDGIAVTEHNGKDFSYKVKAIVDQYFPGELLIIPGWERSGWPLEVVELYLPDGVLFKYLAHPGFPCQLGKFDFLADFHGIEIDNDQHKRHIDKNKVRELAQQYDLLLLSNSDAHTLEAIGCNYNEVSLEELSARARRRP